ncbi:MAG: hypothetical protein PGN13_02600 [Patulibacter minatonensis]
MDLGQGRAVAERHDRRRPALEVAPIGCVTRDRDRVDQLELAASMVADDRDRVAGPQRVRDPVEHHHEPDRREDRPDGGHHAEDVVGRVLLGVHEQRADGRVGERTEREAERPLDLAVATEDADEPRAHGDRGELDRDERDRDHEAGEREHAAGDGGQQSGVDLWRRDHVDRRERLRDADERQRERDVPERDQPQALLGEMPKPEAGDREAAERSRPDFGARRGGLELTEVICQRTYECTGYGSMTPPLRVDGPVRCLTRRPGHPEERRGAAPRQRFRIPLISGMRWRILAALAPAVHDAHRVRQEQRRRRRHSRPERYGFVRRQPRAQLAQARAGRGLGARL